ncbi:MAG: hypothetical protein WDN31_00275 [Hyphomicrobium sp.]
MMRSHGTSPTSDHATRVAFPAAIAGPSGLFSGDAPMPKKNRCECMSPM